MGCNKSIVFLDPPHTHTQFFSCRLQIQAKPLKPKQGKITGLQYELMVAKLHSGNLERMMPNLKHWGHLYVTISIISPK